MRPLLITALPLLFLDALIIPAASDSTLLTISCDQPRGIRMEYGVSVGDALAAAANNVPDPKPSFTGPRPDAYVLKPTILINRACRFAAVVRPKRNGDAGRRILGGSNHVSRNGAIYGDNIQLLSQAGSHVLCRSAPQPRTAQRHTTGLFCALRIFLGPPGSKEMALKPRHALSVNSRALTR